MKQTCALIPAAGQGKRFSESRNKLFAELAGIPVLGRSLLAFQHCKAIDSIIIITSAENREPVNNLASRLNISKLIATVEGGEERQDSVANGLAALPDNVHIVAVHDGARPLVSQNLIERCVDTAIRQGTAIPAIPMIDTVKRAKNNTVLETLDRRELFRVQTPQTFQRNILEDAYHRAKKDGFVGTDEAALVERLGIPVHLVPGEETNLKITTLTDIAAAEAKLGMGFRIGFGYDIHRLVEGRKLFLGGVEIPHSMGLKGHSDADALLHAICDALLGAAGMADIGVHFPDTDPRYAGISSLKLLEEVVRKLSERKFALINIDATVIAEAPKITPHIPMMKERIAQISGLSIDRIGIKATTNEGLGAIGAREGIAAHAVASVVKVSNEGNCMV